MKNNLYPPNINTEDSPAPFHLMKILDEYILFDVSSNRFYNTMPNAQQRMARILIGRQLKE